MLTIKLAKIGKKNKKVFRIVISEKARDPYGKALEILGSYNPYTKDLVVKADRVKYWISKGSGMTASVNNIFIGKNIIEGKKEKNSKVGEPNKRKLEKIEKAKKQEEEARAAKEAEKEASLKKEEPVKEEAPIAEEKVEETTETEKTE